MDIIIFTVLGTLYGFVFGIIPVAGATTALITVYSFIDVFRADPYTLIAFTTAIVVASSVGDSFASIMLNIPGAGGAAASMVDGFPMSKRGEGIRALSAAISTSVLNGLIWGALVFFFLPYYGKLAMSLAVPELLAFMLLSISCVCFLNNKYWFRGLIALFLGCFIGLIGMDTFTGEERFTGGWFYLADGINIVVVMSGILAIPELFEAIMSKTKYSVSSYKDTVPQILSGFRDSWVHRRDGLRGGLVGAIVGILPGMGGNVADWLAYSQTVAMNKNEKVPFGEGNVKGIIGCEGANNAQKATAYLPTVLFGIPGASFGVVVMALLMYVGLELGSPLVMADAAFFNTLTASYMLSLLISFVIGILFIQVIFSLLKVPFHYYFFPILVLIIWSCVQYTGGWEDYAMLVIFSLLGLVFKFLKINRISFLVGFILIDRIEALSIQYTSLYEPFDILTRPLSATLICTAVVVLIYGLFFNRTTINYA